MLTVYLKIAGITPRFQTMLRFFCMAVTLIVCVTCAAQQTTPAQEVHIEISVALDSELRNLDGHMHVTYTNQTNDTLDFLWFHIWPNAFKNDGTAYSEHLLRNGRTDFYFSNEKHRGYINRLIFKSGSNVLEQEDHPVHIDILKIKLDTPLVPGGKKVISGSFHVRLPLNYTGTGYTTGEVTMRNWYPVPALYDDQGWHVAPYTTDSIKAHQPADYHINLLVPAHLEVVTNGRLGSRTVVNDTTALMAFEAKQLHDFLIIGRDTNYWHTTRPVTLSSGSGLIKKWKVVSARQFLPAVGFNVYDGLQLGALVRSPHVNHDESDERRFNWYATPMFALSSKRVTGIAGISHRWTNEPITRSVTVGFDASSFSSNAARDSLQKDVFSGFYMVAPYVRFEGRVKQVQVTKIIEFRTLLIGENNFNYAQSSIDSLFYPTSTRYRLRYLNELNLVYASARVLYPYSLQIGVQQGEAFYRLNAVGKYFFNYPDGGGLRLRLFAAKFGYLGSLTSSEKFATSRYQPKLTAVRGSEDYTYSGFFMGRNEFKGLSAHQIVNRDGGLKLRTDQFQDLQGRSDNWVASVNVSTTIPNIVGVRMPIRVFLDVGTFAEAWDPAKGTSRFLYVAGLQLSLFADLLNVYAPVVFSKSFRDNLKTIPEENSFFRRLSFTVDLHRLILRKPSASF